MSIASASYHYGVALFQLLEKDKGLHLSSFPTQSKNSYSVGKNLVGIYMKYSNKNSSPWTFSFSRQHQEELRIMSEMHAHTFLVLICGKDGITCISYKELKMVLDEFYEESEWIKLSRLSGQSYTLKGHDGVLNHKLSTTNYPRDILASL
jgi:hypothetical protein